MKIMNNVSNHVPETFKTPVITYNSLVSANLFALSSPTLHVRIKNTHLVDNQSP